MLAIAAAVLFAIALILTLAATGVGVLDAQFFFLAGLICAALHLGGVGNTVWVRSHTVRSHPRRKGWRRG